MHGTNNGMDNIKGIRAYCEKIKKRFNTRAIILFGSYARKDFYDDSDIDIIVISDELPEKILDRIYVLMKMNNSSIPIEPHGFTSKEFIRMIRHISITALDAMFEGLVLYDDGFIGDAGEEYEKALRLYDMEKTDYGWKSRRILRDAINRLG